MLYGLRETSTGRIHPLLFPKVVFGRDASQCDVALSEASAGRRHFEVVVTENGKQVQLQDCGSASGTFVNGDRVSGGDDSQQPRSLSLNDRIQVGQTEFVLVECALKGNESVVSKSQDKLIRLSVESARIRAKESFDGLSSSQQKTLEKYEAEIQKLRRIIIDSVNGRSEKGGEDDEGGENDDVYWDAAVAEDDGLSNAFVDLTETRKPVKQQTVETFESLTRKVADLDHECAALEKEIQRLQGGGGAGNNSKDDDDEEDELDKFMAANEQTIKSADLDKAQKKLKTALEDRARYQSLANLARPAIHRLDASSTPSNHSSSSSSFVQPRPAPPPPQQQPTSAATSKGVSALFSMTASAPQIRPNKFRIVQEKIDDNDNREENESSKRAKTLTSSPETTFNESKDSVWVPPSNQKGDGRTKTNERFGY